MRFSEERDDANDLVSDQGGVYQTEYAIVLILVALSVVVALAALAVPLVEYHDSVTRILDVPIL